MSPASKHALSFLGIGVGLLLEIVGVSTMEGSFGVKSVVIKGTALVIAGLAVGLPSVIYHFYYRSGQAKWFPSQPELDVETLAKAADKGKSMRPPAKK